MYEKLSQDYSFVCSMQYSTILYIQNNTFQYTVLLRERYSMKFFLAVPVKVNFQLIAVCCILIYANEAISNSEMPTVNHLAH